jgi:NADPH:quinone reductase-like Zn-dependent oxidoreductase
MAMKAVLQRGYGSPSEVLAVADVDAPTLADDGVLVRVCAASVNALDWHTTRGIPRLMRLSGGRQGPRQPIRGVDLAGRVEAVGKRVTTLRAGDQVFGVADGSFAEYAATTVDRLARLPAGFTHEQAATMGVAGLTALQALRDKARLRAGQRVLVYGAGGGVGTFAVQIARWLGAHVTAVTRTEHVDVVRSIGADVVIDYSAEDFTRRNERYDALIDVGGSRSFAACRRVLRPSGTLVVVGGSADRLLSLATRLLVAVALSPVTRKRVVAFIAKNHASDLALLEQLAEAGSIRPVIDRRYPLDQAAEAIAHVGSGRTRGKIVVLV